MPFVSAASSLTKIDGRDGWGKIKIRRTRIRQANYCSFLLLYLAHWILQTKTQVHRIRKMQLVHSILIGSPNVTLNSFNLLG